MSTLFDSEDIKHEVQSPIKYQYVGFYNSFRTIYPYVHKAFIDPSSEKCSEYDPRFRPWYVAAATGAKNVVLLIDISGSMASYRMDIAKQAAVSVIETLGLQDWFNVVFFSKDSIVIPFIIIIIIIIIVII